MGKWLSSLGYTLASIVAIFLLLPLFLGFLAEKKCKQIIGVINTTTPFSVKVISYQRGWFTANAITQISLEKLELPNQKLQQLNISAHIKHGPIIIDWTRFQFAQSVIKAEINFNEEQSHWLKKSFATEAIANIKIKFRLNGSTAITLDSHPFSYQDQDTNVHWKGLTIRSNFSPLCNKAKSDLDFSGLEIVNNNLSLHLGKINSSYRGNKTKAGLWIGERTLQIDSFSTKNKNDHLIAFDGINIHNIITGDPKNSANIATSITFNNATINNGTYNQNKLDFEVNKLSQDLLTKLQQQIFSNKIISSPASFGFDTLIAILNNGSEIKIKEISTNTSWGKLLASITIAFANQPNSIGILATIANSNVSANIKAEKMLALHLLEKFYQIKPSTNEPNNPEKQAENLLNDWLKSGKLMSSNTDNFLHLILEYKNNQLSINNKALVLTTKP